MEPRDVIKKLDELGLSFVEIETASEHVLEKYGKNPIRDDWPNIKVDFAAAKRHYENGGNVGVNFNFNPTDREYTFVIIDIDNKIAKYSRFASSFPYEAKTLTRYRETDLERAALFFLVPNCTTVSQSDHEAGIEIFCNGGKQYVIAGRIKDKNTHEIAEIKYRNNDILIVSQEHIRDIWEAFSDKPFETKETEPRKASSPARNDNDDSAEVKKSEDKDLFRRLNNSVAVEQVFNKMLSGNETVNEGKSEVRWSGNGGLIVNSEKDVFYNFSHEVGGKSFDAYGWCLYRDAWKEKRTDKKILIDTAVKMAQEFDVPYEDCVLHIEVVRNALAAIYYSERLQWDNRTLEKQVWIEILHRFLNAKKPEIRLTATEICKHTAIRRRQTISKHLTRFCDDRKFLIRTNSTRARVGSYRLNLDAIVQEHEQSNSENGNSDINRTYHTSVPNQMLDMYTLYHNQRGTGSIYDRYRNHPMFLRGAKVLEYIDTQTGEYFTDLSFGPTRLNILQAFEEQDVYNSYRDLQQAANVKSSVTLRQSIDALAAVKILYVKPAGRNKTIAINPNYENIIEELEPLMTTYQKKETNEIDILLRQIDNLIDYVEKFEPENEKTRGTLLDRISSLEKQLETLRERIKVQDAEHLEEKVDKLEYLLKELYRRVTKSSSRDNLKLVA